MTKQPLAGLHRPVSPDALTCAGLATGFTLLYLSFLSRYYVFEGLARAMPIEAGRFRELFNANHMLYGTVGWCFHGLLKMLGVVQLSVHSLQQLDALLGAAGVGLFFLTLRRLDAPRITAALWAAALGFFLGYWLWSIDAENYIFSTFLLQLNFFALVRYTRQRKGHPVLLGALHALAVMGHIVNGVFGVVVLWVIYRTHRRNWLRPALLYVAAVAVLTLGAYALTLAVIVRPQTMDEARRWFMGSAGRTDGAWNWRGGYGWTKLGQWLTSSLNVICSFKSGYQNPPPWPLAGLWQWIARLMLAGFAAAALWNRRRIWRESGTELGACLLWVGAYACVFLSWEPHMLMYHVTNTVPFCVILYLSSRAMRLPAPRQYAAAGVFTLSLGLANFSAEVLPRSYRENNPALMAMDFIRNHTEDRAWIATDLDLDQLYIPFFARRRPLLLGRYGGSSGHERLSGELDRLLQDGQRLYLTSNVLAIEEWRRYFGGAQLEVAARYEDGFTLYRLRGR
ncbi:MAG: hypothetical protein ABIJ96_14430 [Elusimicrobiota bacterium]